MSRRGSLTGIPAYWIINLPERVVEVYANPTGPAAEPDHRQRRDYSAEAAVPAVLDGDEIGSPRVSGLLP